MEAEVTAEMEVVLRDWLENSDNMETAGLRHAILTLLDQQRAEIEQLQKLVWRVRPNEDGEGGETWAAFAADRSASCIVAEQEASKHLDYVKCLQAIVGAAHNWLDGFRQVNQKQMFSDEVFSVREGIEEDAWSEWGQQAVEAGGNDAVQFQR